MSTQQVGLSWMAENEFYGILPGADSCIWFRFLVRFWVLSDSSVARGMTARIGSSLVKHLENRYLWVYDCIRKRQFSMEGIDTFYNMVDLCVSFTPVRVCGY